MKSLFCGLEGFDLLGGKIWVKGEQSETRAGERKYRAAGE